MNIKYRETAPRGSDPVDLRNLRSLRFGFWVANAVVVGVWETTAITTRRLPTISATMRRANVANTRRTHTLLGLWMLALGHHLLHEKPVGTRS